ncbi:hypothetical protein AAFC00_002791 [Neodothiora populina]|uniref:Phosducin domain-containing protein n=1 Tax=Neodothiora populina TaxID=2781224 RepID=A0ABR3P8J0_9PEZI
MASSAAQDEYDDLMARNRAARTHHPEDAGGSDNDSVSLSEEDEASRQETAYPSAPTHNYSRSRSYLPNQRSYNNTGPKGVIADAQAFREAQSAHRASMSASRASSDVNTLVQPYVENLSLNDSAYEGEVALKEIKEEEYDKLRGEADEDLEEDEDDFMMQWRLSRLQELRGKSVIASNAAAERFGMSKSAKLIYEGLTAVDGEGFLEVVDGSPREVTVLVFVWDDRSEVSSMVEDCIRQLARKHKTTRFIKLHYQDAEMEPAGVPAVLAYKGGDKFAGLIPVVEEIPDDANLSPETLESVFQRHQML